ncbi:hypothetical protein HNR65_001676 [Desulfosalsimonas propionicica]|uniref:Ligand-binding SRPBCC domain-containing protein n=1 Tax=Desulfosalsimonas propionicica TaxID=332175 RepID=A0A7W0C947_9BACT|nr:hypothetical protein [Desulfosalsimonas propionicica]MBA2881349.1 hypothetical protein [Desulfosalsimonas propionicica]
MIARISTHFICTEKDLWQKIIEPKALQFVAWPILSFIPDEAGALDGEWIVGKKYNLRLFFLKCIPLGRHIIQLVKIDKTANTISSQEKGKLTRVWNHDITFHEVYPGKVHYIDKIEISAGLRSPVIWLFAHIFYRHRQRRWKLLLERQRGLGKESSGDKG